MPAREASPIQHPDEVTTVVRAPNPSPVTLEGTNTYLLGAPGAGEVLVVDPGPDLIAHRSAVEEELRRRPAAVTAVVLTHHHTDHAEAAGWAVDWQVPLLAFTPALVTHAPADALRDGEVLRRGGVVLQAVHTPGHSSDSICLRVEETGAVLTGDHVLGRGSSVVAHPDGDMADYLASLRRLDELSASALHPGHGPPIDRPAAAIRALLDHRREREREVLDAVRAGERTAAGVVARVYADVDPSLHPLAERSVRAMFAKLVAEGRLVDVGGAVEPA